MRLLGGDVQEPYTDRPTLCSRTPQCTDPRAEALLQNRARILIRFDRAKIARERAMLCADALELLRIRTRAATFFRFLSAPGLRKQRSRSCMRELRNFEVEERAPVARQLCARWPSSGQPAGCRGTGLEILVVRARFLAGRQRLRCSFANVHSRRAVAHSIFRHMNDEMHPSPPCIFSSDRC